MLGDSISKVCLKKLDDFDFDFTELIDDHKNSNTIKRLIVSSREGITTKENGYVEIQIDRNEYLQSLFNELRMGGIRVKQQCNSLSSLILDNPHPAWLLVTAYYASYFIANDLSKASGSYIVNLSEDELRSLLPVNSHGEDDVMKIDSNNSFSVAISHGAMSGDVEVKLRRSSPKPHKIVWDNFYVILNEIKVRDERIKHLNLLKKIVSDDSGRWDNPSKIRNSWNYSNANYFGSKGEADGSKFLTIIKEERSTFRWGGNNNIQPDDINMAAGISYLYFSLKSAHDAFYKRLFEK